MGTWDIETVKKEIKRINPRLEEIIDFESNPDVRKCLKDLEEQKVDLMRIYSILNWAQDMEQAALEGNNEYQKAFEESESITEGAKMIQKGCLKIRCALKYVDNRRDLELLLKPKQKNTIKSKNAENLIKLKESAKKIVSVSTYTIDKNVELLEKLKEVENVILAHPAYNMNNVKLPKNFKFSEGRPAKHYVNNAIIALVDYFQGYFPPKKNAQVNLKACKYTGFFLSSAGLISVNINNRPDLPVRRRYLEIIDKTHKT